MIIINTEKFVYVCYFFKLKLLKFGIKVADTELTPTGASRILVIFQQNFNDSKHWFFELFCFPSLLLENLSRIFNRILMAVD